MIIRSIKESSAITSDQLNGDLRKSLMYSKFNSPKRKRHTLTADENKEYDESILTGDGVEYIQNDGCSSASSNMSESFNLNSLEEKKEEIILPQEIPKSFKFIGETFDNRFGSFSDRLVKDKDTDSINSGDSRPIQSNNSVNRLSTMSVKPPPPHSSSSEVW